MSRILLLPKHYTEYPANSFNYTVHVLICLQFDNDTFLCLWSVENCQKNAMFTDV